MRHGYDRSSSRRSPISARPCPKTIRSSGCKPPNRCSGISKCPGASRSRSIRNETESSRQNWSRRAATSWSGWCLSSSAEVGGMCRTTRSGARNGFPRGSVSSASVRRTRSPRMWMESRTDFWCSLHFAGPSSRTRSASAFIWSRSRSPTGPRGRWIRIGRTGVSFRILPQGFAPIWRRRIAWRPNPCARPRASRSNGSAHGALACWKRRSAGSSGISTGRSRDSANPTLADPRTCSGRSWRSGIAASRKPSSGSIRRRVPRSVRFARSWSRRLASRSGSRMAPESNRGSMPGPGGCAVWRAGFAAVPRDRGDLRRGMDCGARRGRLRQPSPLDLEAVRGRILLDEERGPVKLRRDLLEDPGRDLEALPRAVDAHEIRRDVIRPVEVSHQWLQIGAFDDSLEEGPVLRDDVPRMRDVLRASLDARPELPAVLVAARAIVDGRLPASFEDSKGDRVGPFDAVREFVLHLVSVDLHPREVGLGELHLVQVHEGEALGPGPVDQPDEVGLALRDQRHLDPDGQVERPRETRSSDEATALGSGPEAGGQVEADFIEASLREHPDLVRVRGHRVEMRVELRAEFVVQEEDVVAGALDRVERVSAGDPGVGRPNRVRLFQDVFVSRDALFVREHDVLVHFLVGDGTVEAVEGADAGDEKDHLRAIRALAAADRKRTAGESAVGSLLKAHASTKGRCGIKIPHRWTRVARQMHAAAIDLVPLSGGMIRRDQALDPSPLPRELLLRVSVIGGHPTHEIRLRPFGVDAADVVLFPRGPTVVSLVVPEVEVTPSVELTNPGPASDFHFHTSK